MDKSVGAIKLKVLLLGPQGGTDTLAINNIGTGRGGQMNIKNVYYSGKVSELDMSERIAPFTELIQEAIIFDGKSTMVNCFTRMILPTW